MSFSIDISGGGFGPDELAFVGSDGCPHVTGVEFRWKVIAALPFIAPLNAPYHTEVRLGDRTYAFAIHNNLDRILIRSNGTPHEDSVRLVERDANIKLKLPSGAKAKLERLKSVAIYKQQDTFQTTADAMSGSQEKVRECISHLSTFIFDWQRSLPYLATWVIHPISVYDLGIIYFVLEVYNPRTGKTSLGPAFHAFNPARQGIKPLFNSAPPQEKNEDPIASLADELLAEASSAKHRSMRRLAISNSYLAAEVFGNHVFKFKMKESLLSQGLDEAKAEEDAERLRRANDSNMKFLLHSGMQTACTRSLFNEDNRTYNQILECKSLRNKVQHLGYLPTPEECDLNLRTACEAVQWLTGVMGRPCKSMHPAHVDPESLSYEIDGFGTTLLLKKAKRT